MAATDVNFRLSVPVFCFFCSLYGLWHYLKDVENNNCEMTYMFEYPEYLEIPLNYNVSAQFPRYKLFVYGEGKYADELRSQKYAGIPVLFIPGNAGSHRQVRSLASVSLRIAYSRHFSFHFNFFSIDFNEEVSALYGGTLNDQTEFVEQAIHHIQSLYALKPKVTLIGHSMGGVLAKAVFALPSFDPSDIFLIVTLASPHRRPVVAADSAVVEFYQKIQASWRYRQKSLFKNIPIVSIGGGQRDTLVRSDLIQNDFLHPSPLDVHVLTPAIPGVWLSTDHLAIVWCKQLVMTISRSLFDFHNQKKNQVLSSIFLLIPVEDDILILASGLAKDDWLFGCIKFASGENATCSEGENLSHEAEIIPPRKPGTERRKALLRRSHILNKGYLAVFIYIAPVDSQVEILGETFSEAERVKTIQLPSLLERIFSLSPQRLFTISLVDQVVYYNVTVPKSSGVFDAVLFQLETRLCRAGSTVGHGIAKLHLPWCHEDAFYPLKSGKTQMPAISHSLPSGEESPDTNLVFYLDPECSVVLTATFSLSLAASQFMKFYGIFILGNAVAFFFIFLGIQMYSFGIRGSYSSIGSINKVPTFLTLVVMPTIFFHFIWFASSYFKVLPLPDVLDPSFSIFRSLLLRSLLYWVSSGLTISVCLVFEALLHGISATRIYAMPKNVLKTTQVPLEKMSQKRVKLSKRTIFISAVLAALCVGISSSLAAVITFTFYFLKLCSMHLRCQLEEERRGPSKATVQWHIHYVLVLLWLVAALLTSPGLVTWARSLPFSLRLSRDVYSVPTTLMVLASAVIWQLPSPVITQYKYKAVAFFIQVLAFTVTLYGVSSMHRLLNYIASVFVVISIHQVFAYFNGPAFKKVD